MNKVFTGKLLLLLSIVFLFFQCSEQRSYYEASGFVFGTSYHILYETDKGEIEQSVFDSLFTQINQSLSPFEENSIISRVNRSERVEVDSFFSRVFMRAQYISEETDGGFDITVAPLVNAWGFGFDQLDTVSAKVIDSLKQFVGYEKVSLVGNQIVKQTPNLMLDASAIAKGYSCDVVANYFLENGVTNFMVEVGGEVVTHGVNMRGGNWVIGITQPDEKNSIFTPVLQDCISLGNAAMATSGNYRQFYYKEGKRYSHTIDPKTGFPVEHNLLSVTVLADDCMTADAFATAFMVKGMEWSYSYVEKKANLAAYFIYSDENDSLQVRYTPTFEKYLIK